MMKRVLAGILMIGACAAAQADNLLALNTTREATINNADYTAPVTIRKHNSVRPFSADEQKIISEYHRIIRERQYVLAQAEKPPEDPAPPKEEAVLMAPVAEIPLFTHVKYKDCDEMAPCPTKKVVEVMNPCKRCCTDPDCVFIEICVPTCGCETVKCRWGGRRVRYDYGKYAVDVRVKNGYIEVDYQD